MCTVHPIESRIPVPLSELPPLAGVQAQTDLPAAVSFFKRVLDAIPSMAMLLNPERQILLANRRLV